MLDLSGLSVSGMISGVVAQGGASNWMVYLFCFVGIVLVKPIFVLIMSNVEFRNPLADKSGGAMIAVGLVGALGCVVLLAGPRSALRTVEAGVVNPVRIAMGQDTCDTAQGRCTTVWIDGRETYVNPWDTVAGETRVPAVQATPVSLRPRLRPDVVKPENVVWVRSDAPTR